MRIYIAAPYAVRNELRIYAQELANDGHICTSSWLNADHEINPGTLETAPDFGDDYAEEHSLQDVEDVASSDLLILITWEHAELLALGRDLGGNSGGRHVETGVALALSIPVLVVGPPENIFHRGVCTVAEDWAEALKEVSALHDRRFA